MMPDDNLKLKSLANTLEAWAEPFAGRGISPALLKEAFPEKPPASLFNLYQNCKKLKSYYGLVGKQVRNVSITSTWQLQCLSGDEHIAAATMLQFKQSETPKDNLGANPIHYLIFSGLTGIVEKIRAANPDLKNCTDYTGRNFMHIAAQSGSPEMLRCINDTFKEHAIGWAKATTNVGWNLMHIAVASDSPEMLRCISDTFKDDAKQWAKAPTKVGYNIMHIAALSDSPEMVSNLLIHYPHLIAGCWQPSDRVKSVDAVAKKYGISPLPSEMRQHILAQHLQAIHADTQTSPGVKNALAICLPHTDTPHLIDFATVAKTYEQMMASDSGQASHLFPVFLELLARGHCHMQLTLTSQAQLDQLVAALADNPRVHHLQDYLNLTSNSLDLTKMNDAQHHNLMLQDLEKRFADAEALRLTSIMPELVTAKDFYQKGKDASGGLSDAEAAAKLGTLKDSAIHAIDAELKKMAPNDKQHLAQANNLFTGLLDAILTLPLDNLHCQLTRERYALNLGRVYADLSDTGQAWLWLMQSHFLNRHPRSRQTSHEARLVFASHWFTQTPVMLNVSIDNYYLILLDILKDLPDSDTRTSLLSNNIPRLEAPTVYTNGKTFINLSALKDFAKELSGDEKQTWENNIKTQNIVAIEAVLNENDKTIQEYLKKQDGSTDVILIERVMVSLHDSSKQPTAQTINCACEHAKQQLNQIGRGLNAEHGDNPFTLASQCESILTKALQAWQNKGLLSSFFSSSKTNPETLTTYCKLLQDIQSHQQTLVIVNKLLKCTDIDNDIKKQMAKFITLDNAVANLTDDVVDAALKELKQQLPELAAVVSPSLAITSSQNA